MDVTKLILNLRSTVTDDALDQQMISKAIKLLEVGAVINADTYAELPNPTTVAGQLYFVNFDGLYWSTGAYWLPIVKTTADTAWSWGYNSAGRLGDNSTTNKSSPVSVVGNFGDWCRVYAADTVGFGIRSDRTLWTWGSGASGRLGDNTTTNKSSPVLVAGGFPFAFFAFLKISASDNSLFSLKNCFHSDAVKYFPPKNFFLLTMPMFYSLKNKQLKAEKGE